MSESFEPYLAELQRSLALYPGRCADVLDEVRDHLLEARERALQSGSSSAEAERRALQAFGPPGLLARRFVAQKSRTRVRKLLPLALLVGLGMAYVDNLPNWDDTGVSAFAVLASTALLGLFEPTRPYLWAAAIGAWFPLLSIVLHGNYGAFMALGIAFIGAYGGCFARRLSAS